MPHAFHHFLLPVPLHPWSPAPTSQKMMSKGLGSFSAHGGHGSLQRRRQSGPASPPPGHSAQGRVTARLRSLPRGCALPPLGALDDAEDRMCDIPPPHTHTHTTTTTPTRTPPLYASIYLPTPPQAPVVARACESLQVFPSPIRRSTSQPDTIHPSPLSAQVDVMLGGHDSDVAFARQHCLPYREYDILYSRRRATPL